MKLLTTITLALFFICYGATDIYAQTYQSAKDSIVTAPTRFIVQRPNVDLKYLTGTWIFIRNKDSNDTVLSKCLPDTIVGDSIGYVERHQYDSNGKMYDLIKDDWRVVYYYKIDTANCLIHKTATWQNKNQPRGEYWSRIVHLDSKYLLMSETVKGKTTIEFFMNICARKKWHFLF